MKPFPRQPLRRRLIGAAAAALCTFGALGPLQAQTAAWPSAKPIRLVVGFAAGGTTDVMARIVAKSLSESLGQSVVVDNKPGASSNVAASEVVRAQPDGYTFLVAPTSVETANPFLFKQTLNPAKDLTPVAGIGRSQMYLVVKPQSPFKDARELVEFARKNPGKLSYASAGSGTPPHLAAELFKQAAGIFAVHIPYRGAAPALQDVLGGPFTAKDFRTWGATLFAFRTLATMEVPEAEAARRQVRMQVLRDTAAILGNTPRICERCYVDPRVFEGWEDGRLQRTAANARGPRQWEQAASRFLRRARRGS